MGKIGCIRAKVVVLEQKWFYSGKVVVIGQTGRIVAKVVVFRQKRLYSGKVLVFGQKWSCSGKNGCIRT